MNYRAISKEYPELTTIQLKRVLKASEILVEISYNTIDVIFTVSNDIENLLKAKKIKSISVENEEGKTHVLKSTLLLEKYLKLMKASTQPNKFSMATVGRKELREFLLIQCLYAKFRPIFETNQRAYELIEAILYEKGIEKETNAIRRRVEEGHTRYPQVMGFLMTYLTPDTILGKK